MSALAMLDLSGAFVLKPLDAAAIRLDDNLFLTRPRPPTPEGGSASLAAALAAEPTMPVVGAMLDKYRLERVLGMGGFAVVYRARHTILESAVALKLLRPSVVSRRPGLATMMCEEARFAARIRHPHVVHVFDVTSDKDLTYIVMEYIDGPDLEMMLRRKGVLPPKMVMKIMRHVCAGLAAGQRENLVHRDVKPSNILLTRDGVTKLADFGLARSLSDPSDGGQVGTVGYMSPEHVSAPGRVDFRSDMYSLGVTAYRALIGELPFSAADARRCAELHRSEPVVPLRDRDATIPHGVNDVILWLLEKSPDRRPSSYAELDGALRDAISRGER